jgi:hypothetical protein
VPASTSSPRSCPARARGRRRRRPGGRRAPGRPACPRCRCRWRLKRARPSPYRSRPSLCSRGRGRAWPAHSVQAARRGCGVAPRSPPERPRGCSGLRAAPRAVRAAPQAPCSAPRALPGPEEAALAARCAAYPCGGPYKTKLLGETLRALSRPGGRARTVHEVWGEPARRFGAAHAQAPIVAIVACLESPTIIAPYHLPVGKLCRGVGVRAMHICAGGAEFSIVAAPRAAAGGGRIASRSPRFD